MQIDRYSAGSAQQELYPKDIENIVIPFIDESQQQKISECILDSYKEKDIGLATINLVQKAVSIAIKQNETEAIAWLKGKGIHWSVLKNMDYE